MRERAFFCIWLHNQRLHMTPLEKLSPDTVLAEAQKRADELSALIEEKKRALGKAPSGRIRIQQRGNNHHCYHITDPNRPSGDYIPLSNQKLIKALVQKEYDQSVLIELQQELNLLDKFIEKYKPSRIINILEVHPETRLHYITPLQISDEKYSDIWQAIPYKGKPFDENAPEFITSKGEQVRSKSEMIIADTLAKYKIPYKYESPMQMNTSSHKSLTIYPDFTCLNVRKRKQFLWEHFGRMEDSVYSAQMVRKMRTFSRNGFIPGTNLLFTTESNSSPLDRRDVEQLIKTFLL